MTGFADYIYLDLALLMQEVSRAVNQTKISWEFQILFIVIPEIHILSCYLKLKKHSVASFSFPAA